MTSNVGAETLRKGAEIGFHSTSEKGSYESMKSKLLEEIKRTFRPEFLNRVDEMIVFHALTKQHLKQIVEMMLDEVRERLKEYGVTLTPTAKAIDYLIEEGYNPIYGARPLRRAIQRYVEDPLAEKILKKGIPHNCEVVVTRQDNQLEFKTQKQPVGTGV